MNGPPTPYLCVDRNRLRRNVRRAAERAALTRTALRPHVKTHKSPEIARLQLSSGAVGLTVATIGEAEVFVRHGCTDVFIAYPLWLDERAAGRLLDLAGASTLAIGVDSVVGAANAGRLLGGSGIEVLVEVDSGQHRSGCSARGAGQVAIAARRTGLRVRGVFTFPGHGYEPGSMRQAAQDEAATLLEARRSLEAEGFTDLVLSGGSTPTAQDSDLSVVDELRPGVYVFGDAQQWELGTMEPDDIALTCRATVVSNAGGRMVLDAGSKVLGGDRAGYSTGFGRLIAHPDARFVLLAEHHAVVDMAGAPIPAPGSLVEVIPNHVCAAVNLADDLWVDENGTLRAWPVTARGQNA